MKARIIGAALAALSIVTPASAQECTKKLQLLAALPMTKWHDGDLVTVPVSINGVEKQFMLDTGGYFTQIPPTMASELKIPVHQTKAQMTAMDGSISRDQITAQKFAIGPLHTENYEIPVAPNTGFDGIFSPVGYKTVDFDMDFSAAKLNILFADHCEGKVFYWPHQVSTALPLKLRDNKVIVRVTLDGKDWDGIIDTGASTSSMLMDKAKLVYELRPDSPNMTVAGHVGNDDNAPIFAYPFKTLSIGDITIANPHIRINSGVTDKAAERRAARTSPNALPEITLGMDVLRKLHLYLAQNEGKLYITEASAPAPAQAKD